MVDDDKLVVERVQTGVRIEKHLLKVLKGLAELKDITLGDLLEGIVLHAFEGKAPFSSNSLKEIEELKDFKDRVLERGLEYIREQLNRKDAPAQGAVPAPAQGFEGLLDAA